MIMAPTDPFNLSSYNPPIDLATVAGAGFVLGIIILLFWTLRRSAPLRTTTGGLAGLREQARSFHTRFGRGGYRLGYTVDSPYSRINILSQLLQRGPKVLRLSPADR